MKPTAKDQNPLKENQMRRFVLDRTDDESGVSGIGIVAEGVEFSNGQCALAWLSKESSVAVYPNIKQLERIHGHNGRTVVRWLD